MWLVVDFSGVSTCLFFSMLLLSCDEDSHRENRDDKEHEISRGHKTHSLADDLAISRKTKWNVKPVFNVMSK